MKTRRVPTCPTHEVPLICPCCRAAEGAAATNAATSPEERKAKASRAGARGWNLTPEERAARTKRMREARWGKRS